MKKIILYLVLSIMIILPLKNVQALTPEKVSFHVFYAEYCPHCKELHEYLDELIKDKDYKDKLEVIYYRVDNSTNYGENENYQKNITLFKNVTEYYKFGSGVPFYVVGNTPAAGFAKNKSEENIKKMIDNELNNVDYKDIVTDIIENKIKIEVVEPDNQTVNNFINTNSKKLKNKKVVTVVGVVVIFITLITTMVIIYINLSKK